MLINVSQRVLSSSFNRLMQKFSLLFCFYTLLAATVVNLWNHRKRSRRVSQKLYAWWRRYFEREAVRVLVKSTPVLSPRDCLSGLIRNETNC